MILSFLFSSSLPPPSPVRPKIMKIAKAHVKDALRSYILRPVVRSVEMNEPLKYLTEMRQVVIVFVNATINEIKNKRSIRLINAAYKLVCRYI